jgi:DNA repair protein SbcD/Mre11
MRDGAPVIAPWEPSTMAGSHVDVLDGKVRVYGLPWQGAATARSIEGLAHALEAAATEEEAAGIEYRLLMMHSGVDGVVPRVQGLPTMSHFQALRHHVDYLALGHVHKPYEFDDWIYNPGSTETCGAEEAAWEDRGYYFVEIDNNYVAQSGEADTSSSKHRASHLVSKRRPFARLEVRVDGLGEPNEVYNRLDTYCRRERSRYEGDALRPLVQVQLIGTLAFDAGSLDRDYMEKLVKDLFEALYAHVENNTNDRDYVPEGGELDGRDRSTWHELERRIFEDLVSRDSRYLAHREQWSQALADLKRLALEKEDPAEIAQFLRNKRAELLEA